MFINIIVTPLRQGDEEPSPDKTREFFEGFAHNQNLFEESNGTIEVLFYGEVLSNKLYGSTTHKEVLPLC